MGYTLSVTRLPTRKDLEDEEVCACCGEPVRRALANLFDTSLLKSPSFVMLCISGFLTLMGIFTPVTYLQGIILKTKSKTFIPNFFIQTEQFKAEWNLQKQRGLFQSSAFPIPSAELFAEFCPAVLESTHSLLTISL